MFIYQLIHMRYSKFKITTSILHFHDCKHITVKVLKKNGKEMSQWKHYFHWLAVWLTLPWLYWNSMRNCIYTLIFNLAILHLNYCMSSFYVARHWSHRRCSAVNLFKDAASHDAVRAEAVQYKIREGGVSVRHCAVTTVLEVDLCGGLRLWTGGLVLGPGPAPALASVVTRRWQSVWESVERVSVYTGLGSHLFTRHAKLVWVWADSTQSLVCVCIGEFICKSEQAEQLGSPQVSLSNTHTQSSSSGSMSFVLLVMLWKPI